MNYTKLPRWLNWHLKLQQYMYKVLFVVWVVYKIIAINMLYNSVVLYNAQNKKNQVVDDVKPL